MEEQKKIETESHFFEQIPSSAANVPIKRKIDSTSLGVRNAMNELVRIGKILDAFRYTDTQTGLAVTSLSQEEMSKDEVAERGIFFSSPPKNGSKVTMKVVDKAGKEVGTFVKLILVGADGCIIVEDDTSILNVQGTGFGTRFQEYVENGYRAAGVSAIVRGCGLSIGRYEGAKFGYDFSRESQRNDFREAFIAFMREKGVYEVSFEGKMLSLESLRSLLRTPTDYLRVTADRNIAYVLDGSESTLPPDQVGKAFFLDQESEAKRRLDPENEYRGKWLGIKRLA